MNDGMRAPRAPATRRLSGRGGARVAAAVLALAIAGAVGIAVWQDRIAPFRATVLVVDDRPFRMQYLLARTFMSGQEPLRVLQTIAIEEIVRGAAAAPPFDIEVSEAEVDAALRALAGGALSEAEFAEWLRQQVNASRLEAEEFRELTRTRLVMRRMQEVLAARVPPVTPQLRLQMIVLASLEEAAAARARLASGDAFEVLARELNADPTLRAHGGEIGWYPRALLVPGIAEAVFGGLAPGETSAPVPLEDGSFALLRVAEADPARALSPEALEALRESALDDWVADAFADHEVEMRGFGGGYDSATDAWVRAQVERLEAGVPGAPR